MLLWGRRRRPLGREAGRKAGWGWQEAVPAERAVVWRARIPGARRQVSVGTGASVGRGASGGLPGLAGLAEVAGVPRCAATDAAGFAQADSAESAFVLQFRSVRAV